MSVFTVVLFGVLDDGTPWRDAGSRDAETAEAALEQAVDEAERLAGWARGLKAKAAQAVVLEGDLREAVKLIGDVGPTREQEQAA